MTISEEDRTKIGLWAADCAEHVLPLFEAQAPSDPRPRQAIEDFRAFSRGQMCKGQLRAAFSAAYAAAREVGDPCAAAAARAAGLVAGSPYMHAQITLDQAKHVLGPAMYAARARELAAGNNSDAGDEEIRWAITHASATVRSALRRMPTRSPGRSRLDALLYQLDAGLRNEPA